MNHMRWVKILLNVGGIGLILSRSYALLFNPTLMMDEGFYIGATRAITNGDIFLQHYSFDKPFLLPFWPLLGVLSFGFTPFGMRFVGLLCYLASFVLSQKILNKLVEKPILSFFLSLTLYALPFVHEHGVSAMSEPYLLLAMNLFFLWMVQRKDERRVFHAFYLGFMTKFSMALWFPVLGLAWYRQKKFLSQLRKFIAVGKYWIIAWTMFGLINATKFASLTWFAELGKNDQASQGFFERLAYWFPTTNHAFGGTWVSAFWLIALLLGFVRRSLRKRDDSYFAIWLPTFLHFLVIVFSGNRGFERYLVTLVPGVAICTALLINELPIRFFARPIGTVFFAVLAFVALNHLRAPLGGDPALGRQLMFINDEYNRTGTILHTDFLWQSAPFRDKMIAVGCTTDKCIRQYRVGVKSQPDQFVLKEIMGAPGFEFMRLPPVMDMKTKPAPREIVTVDHEWIRTQLQEKLRMKKSLTVSKFDVAVDGKFVLEGEIRGHQISVNGALLVNDLSEYPREMNQRRLSLVAQVLQVVVDGTDWTDAVMTIFYHGYSLHLGPVDVKRAQYPADVELKIGYR
ncbi:MAG: hypothetical protein JST80_08480 [Bdellovibrionales bacterium]|nr:hypothetical protein [Bdellovibrionales bacterium]